MKIEELSDAERAQFFRFFELETIHTFQCGSKEYRIIIPQFHVDRIVPGGSIFSPRLLFWDKGLARKWVTDRVEAKFRSVPWLVRFPPEGICPPFLVMARLVGDQPINSNEHTHSQLVLVWLVDDLNFNPMEDLKKQMEGLNWEEHARNFKQDYGDD